MFNFGKCLHIWIFSIEVPESVYILANMTQNIFRLKQMIHDIGFVGMTLLYFRVEYCFHKDLNMHHTFSQIVLTKGKHVIKSSLKLVHGFITKSYVPSSYMPIQTIPQQSIWGSTLKG